MNFGNPSGGDTWPSTELARSSSHDIVRTRWDDSTEHLRQMVTDQSSSDDNLGQSIIVDHASYDRPAVRPETHARMSISRIATSTVHGRQSGQGRPYPVMLGDILSSARDMAERVSRA